MNVLTSTNIIYETVSLRTTPPNLLPEIVAEIADLRVQLIKTVAQEYLSREPSFVDFFPNFNAQTQNMIARVLLGEIKRLSIQPDKSLTAEQKKVANDLEDGQVYVVSRDETDSCFLRAYARSTTRFVN